MKNYAFVALLACVALMTVAATPSHAQVLIQADVPFSFSAGSGVLPAGEYSITSISQSSALLLSSGTRGIEMMVPQTRESRNDVAVAKLVFHRYGDEYFLAEIWTNADDAVRTLAVHPRERKLAKSGLTPQVSVVYGLAPSSSGN